MTDGRACLEEYIETNSGERVLSEEMEDQVEPKYLLIALLLLGCTTPSTMLVNRDGKVIRCATSGGGTGVAGAVAIGMASQSHNRCVSDMQRVGYVIIPDTSLNVNFEKGKTPPTVSAVGPAAKKAGIVVNDQVLAVDGKPVKDQFSIIAAIQSKQVGDEVKVRLNRSGEIIEVPLQLVERKLN